MKLYMMVTLDKYELPVCVTDNVKELAKFSGRTINQINSLMSKYKHGVIKKSSFISVDLDVEEEVE